MDGSRKIVALLAGLFVGAGVCASVHAETVVASEAMASVKAAEVAVDEARIAIAKGQEMIALIPEDSPLMPEVAEVIKAASANWKIAVEALKGAGESAEKIPTATSESLAGDFTLLTKANASVALSGAKVVQIAIGYVDAVANEKTESLEIIHGAMQDALAATSQVQSSYDRVKKLISEKYSK